MTSRGPLPSQPFCDACIDDNRLTLSLEEKDNRVHVGPEARPGLALGDNDLTSVGNDPVDLHGRPDKKQRFFRLWL